MGGKRGGLKLGGRKCGWHAPLWSYKNFGTIKIHKYTVCSLNSGFEISRVVSTQSRDCFRLFVCQLVNTFAVISSWDISVLLTSSTLLFRHTVYNTSNHCGLKRGFAPGNAVAMHSRQLIQIIISCGRMFSGIVSRTKSIWNCN